MCAQPFQLCTPPSSSVHGILQTRILEWVAMSSSRVSSQSRCWTCVSCISCIEGRFFTAEPPGKPPKHILLCIWITRGFPCGSAGKAPACNVGDLGFIPELGIPWRRKWLPTPVFWSGELRGLYSLWGHNALDTTEWLSLGKIRISEISYYNVSSNSVDDVEATILDQNVLGQKQSHL